MAEDDEVSLGWELAAILWWVACGLAGVAWTLAWALTTLVPWASTWVPTWLAILGAVALAVATTPVFTTAGALAWLVGQLAWAALERLSRRAPPPQP